MKFLVIGNITKDTIRTKEKEIVKELPQKEASKYIYAVGKRKCAVARIRLLPKGKGEITINHKKSEQYLPDFELQEIIKSPLNLTDTKNKYDFYILVSGGGKKGQAEAIRHGIARALEKLNKELRKTLKVAGFLMRDARIKERKKPGLKRARRAPQWSKR
jgi:small subunit ribosomal protein S9